jgi:DNA transposition AAA+ family ATPase
MITLDFKKRVVAAIKQDADHYPSASKQATSLGINAAQLSRIKNGELEQLISDEKWILIGRRLGVAIVEGKEWLTAKTPTFAFIYEQLQFCKENGISGLLCDHADIGKTHTAKVFTKENKATVYIDCAQVKSKQKLIRQIAKEFGINHTCKYAEVYEDLVYYLQLIERPMIILDEAGDLDYPAFLELKALWNATERTCAWYMMGADGLKTKIDANLSRRKVGYVEIFSRYGKSYQKATPEGREELERFNMTQVALIAKANMPDANVQQIYARTNGSLRRLRTELSKMN